MVASGEGVSSFSGFSGFSLFTILSSLFTSFAVPDCLKVASEGGRQLSSLQVPYSR